MHTLIEEFWWVVPVVALWCWWCVEVSKGCEK